MKSTMTATDVAKMHAWIGDLDYSTGADHGVQTVDEFMKVIAGYAAADIEGADDLEISIMDADRNIVTKGRVGDYRN